VDSALEAIQSIVREYPPQARCFFVIAPGGAGKTCVFNMLMSHLHHNGSQVACAAWTEISATLLTGGKTVHSLFKLPVPVVETSSCNVSPTSHQADILHNQMLFIIDEASMIPTHALHAKDRCLQDITAIRQPFGGKAILFSRDFRQVLPIVPQSPPDIVIDTRLKRSFSSIGAHSKHAQFPRPGTLIKMAASSWQWSPCG